MLQTPLAQLTAQDLNRLVADGVRESRSLDFKRDAVGARDDDKRELLADVSAFANSIGGDLVLGVDEVQGVAQSVVGIPLTDPDAEIRRLDQVIRSGLEPRLPRCDLQWVPISPTHGVLVIRTPRSWAAPHRVVFRGDARFYARSSAGKHLLDVAELRAASLASEAVPERIRRFRRERLTILESGDGPLPLREGARLTVHLIPLSAFTDPRQIVLTEDNLFRPMGAMGYNSTHCLDGLVSYTGAEDAAAAVRAYSLGFRNGVVEAASAIGGANPDPWLSLSGIEQAILDNLPQYFTILGRLNVEPPFFLMLSLTSVKGYVPHLPNRFFVEAPRPLRSDVVALPELMLESIPPNLPAALQPTFDLLWNAFGFARSFSYQPGGVYVRN